MSKLFLSFLLVVLSIYGTTQSAAQNRIPPFKILLSNGTYFSPDKLVRNKAVVLIYFSPDCDHCRTLMQSFFKQAGQYKNVEVVMITFKPLEEVTRFVYDYSVGKYPNINVGTEGNTFFIRQFYKLTNTPFVAVFNKEGSLVKSFREISEAAPITEEIRKL